MSNLFNIKNGLNVEGSITVPSGATVDGVDISAHVGSGGSSHALVVASVGGSGGSAGFISAVDKEKLDGLSDYEFPGLSNDDAGIITNANSSYPYSATLVNNSVTNAMLAGSIETSKLVDGALFLKSDGTVPLTASWTINTGGTNYRILGLPLPTSNSEAANKEYVDNAVSGFNLKDPVDYATTTNITLSGEQIIDGGTTNSSRILVKNQTDRSENGIYTSSSGAWTRTSDADENEEVTLGMSTFVEGGTVNANSSWAVSTINPSPTDLGTSDIIFTLFARTGTITAGNGLDKTGTTIFAVGTTNRISVSASGIDISAAYKGQTSIDTLGTITSGTWQGTAIAANKGGTGQTSYATGDILYANSATTLNRLSAQAAGRVLISGSTPSWNSVGLATHVSGVLPIANGGTNGSTATTGFNNLSPATTVGDIIAHDGTDNVRISGNTAEGKQFLSSEGALGAATLPSWETIIASDVSDFTNAVNNILQSFNGSINGSLEIINLGTVTTGSWAASIIPGQYGGTGVANTGKTITLGGNLVTSGAHNTTLTTTADTNVTLPATGTLATLAGIETFTNKTLTSPFIGGGATFTGSAGIYFTNGTSTITFVPATMSTNTTVTIPNKTGTIALLTNHLGEFAATTSAQLASVVSDETGSGALVFANSPTLVTPDIGDAIGGDIEVTTINGVRLELSSNTLKIGEYDTVFGDRSVYFVNTTLNPITFNLGADATANTINLGTGGTLGGMAYAPAEITTPADEDILFYDASDFKWVNGSLTSLGLFFSSGGTLTGDITLGGNNINNVSNITYNAGGTALNTYIEVTHSNDTIKNIYVPSITTVKTIHFDYMAHDDPFTNIRAGTVIVLSEGTNVRLAEFSTSDIGDTTQYRFSAHTSTSGGVVLKATPPSGSTNWKVKGHIRTI